ncbi:histidine phosphatase superfamily [Aspergillus ambiguus]|uniref:histidine phosphatase family protein n=1 Tax=Aspergillus ambiguus TaxID=176160 RepID=UPI003CCCFE04
MHTVISAVFLLAVASYAGASAINPRSVSTTTTPTSTTNEPNWFQTTPESYQGVTATGVAPFLAETNPAPFGQKTYQANDPLETGEPIKGAKGRNIFHHLGDLSPYFSPDDGFGVDEHPLPKGSNITQMHMIHRHGARYPSSSEGLPSWAAKIANSTVAGNRFTGALSFLNDWNHGLGAEILVPQGRLELFESGVVNYYNYGHLLNRTAGHKLVVRTTTQDRMLKSAENFLAGFFGLDWTDHANLLPMIEAPNYNNSLIGMYSCPRALTYLASGAYAAPLTTWENIYLAERTAVLTRLSGSYNWTTADTHNAQTLCAYETVSYGYSAFCELFTFEEFEGFAYGMDLMFAAMSGFQNPTGRAQGIAWVAEFIARVEGHVLTTTTTTTGTNANITLDSNPVTFPVDQNLYLDFSHDAGVVAALTAFGFRQFAAFLPPTGPPRNQQFHTSKIVPFAGRTNIEIIRAPHRVVATRPRGAQDVDAGVYVPGTAETFYIHFLQNQRTLPLHASFPECEVRDDGWCELDTFMAIQKQSLEKAQFEYACYGNWTMPEYGEVTDGVPPK